MPQRLSVWRMQVDGKVSGKWLFEIQLNFPIMVRTCRCGPAYLSETRWTLTYPDPPACRKPMLRRGLLQMAHLRVILLIAKQPAKAHRRLQDAVHDSRPAIAVALSGCTGLNPRVLRSVAIARVGGVAGKRVQREQKRPIILLPYTYRQRAMLHEI